MGLRIAALGAALWALAFAVPAPAGTAPPDRAVVEAFVDGAVAEALARDHVAGAAVAVVDRSGLVMAKGYGLAATSPRRAVTADTLFRVGSISKTAVWIAVMQLVEQGRIGLDDPVNDHLPPALRLPDDGFAAPVRIRHLMTYTAGFEDSVLGGFFVRDPRALLPTATWLRTHRVRRVRPPGEVAVYSNYGAVLAAAIVEQVSGEPWEDYAERHILRPLGMETATYREPYPASLAHARGLPPPLSPALAAQTSQGFDEKAGRLEPQPWEYVHNVAPAGALSASARDMAAYMAALLDPARLERAGVLRAATFAQIQEPLFANTPELGGWRHGFMDLSAARGRPGFGHGGDLIFQHATLEIYPRDGVAVFVAVNTPTGEGLRDTLPVALLARLAGPLPLPPPRVSDAKVQAARVAGSYRTLRRPYFRSERALLGLFSTAEVKALPDGDILLGGGEQALRYRAVGSGLFAAESGPGRIAFHPRGGRMAMFDPFSVAPAERIGVFQTSAWLLAIGAVACVTVGWGVGSGVRRAFRRLESDRPAALVLDGLCGLWTLALLLLAAGAALLGDRNQAVFTYPGPLLPAALWALALAAAATPLAALAAFGPLRPRRWSHWRWIRQVGALLVLTAFAATLWSWGFLGYSGW